MEEQLFKPNNKLWNVLLVIYLIAAAIYLFNNTDSFTRLDTLNLNPLVGFIAFYPMYSRKVIIDSMSIRFESMGKTSFDIPIRAIQKVEIRHSFWYGGQGMYIHHTNKSGKTKKVYIAGAFDLEGIQERLAVLKC